MEVCRACKRGPARTVTVRRHVGMLVAQRFIKLRAPLCRECGHKYLKQYTGQTLVQGWWGIISFFANLHCLAGNLFAYRAISRLPEPVAIRPQTTEQDLAA